MVILSLFSFLLAFAAVYGDWISFPITLPISGSQIIWTFENGFILKIGIVFQMILGGGVILLVLRQFVGSAILLCAALVILLLLPWYGGFIHPHWLADYVLQSQEKLELYQFTQNYFVPNFNSEPTFVPIRQFESLTDQAGIAFAMLGWGWYFALIGNLALLAILLHHWRFSFKLLIMFLLIISLWIMPVQQSALRLLQAEKAHNAGDKFLINGQAQLALHYYTEAVKYNPALSLSTPFLIKVSDAYAYMSDGYHPLAQVTEAWRLMQKARSVAQSKKYPLYQESRKVLSQLTTLHPPLSDLEQALFELGLRLHIKLWRHEGLAEFAQKNLNKALNAFLQARDDKIAAQFYLAYTYLLLGNTQAALSLLQPLAEKVAHPDVKADIYCTIGDAYTQAKLADAARKAYTSCYKFDSIKNYRAIKALSGF